MQKSKNSFEEIKNLLNNFKLKKNCDAIFIDLHGEAASEKQAFAFMVDGKVTAVLGTHTHVPTSDLRVLPKGTAYQTDTGMCGDYDSVIGGDKNSWIKKFEKDNSFKKSILQIKIFALCGAIIKVNKNNGLSTFVEQIIIGKVLKISIPSEKLFISK